MVIVMQDRECSGHGSCALGKCYCQVSIIIFTDIFLIIIIVIIITQVGWTGDSCEERNEQIFR